MKEIFVRWIAPAAVVCALAWGCAKTRPPVAPATCPAATAPSVDASAPASVRVREITRLSEDYSTLSHQLPGKTPDEHRQIMHNAFDKLDQILGLLADPRADLVFRQHLMVLEDARSQLGDSPSEVAVDATIDTGLRSAYNALTGIAHGKDFDDTDFTAPLADMKTRLDELDTVRGLTHQVVVGEAVEASSVLVNKFADVLGSRIVAGAPGGATTVPAATPGAEPIAAPASEPATRPAAPETAPAAQPQ